MVRRAEELCAVAGSLPVQYWTGPIPEFSLVAPPFLAPAIAKETPESSHGALHSACGFNRLIARQRTLSALVKSASFCSEAPARLFRLMLIACFALHNC